MNRNDILFASVAISALASGLLVAAPALAQAQSPSLSDRPQASLPEPADGSGDIIVTARKRDETLQSVPVTVTAVTAATLEARGITNLEGIARTIPQLILGASSGSIQGGALAMRGVGAGDNNLLGDQAVSFNVDGVQVARSSLRRFSQFDLQQVEVLKGPQALFYGKNSPGGIIVVRTADPGDHFEAGTTATYEFNAQEVRGEGFVSTPLTESLGLRVALTGAHTRGWVRNIATPGTIYSPDDKFGPRNTEYGGRLTLKFDDGGPLKARFKFAYTKSSGDSQYFNTQRVACVNNIVLLAPQGDCKADDRTTSINLGPRIGAGGVNTVTGAPFGPVVPLFGDGAAFSRDDQYLSGLELNYALSDWLSVASTTGFFRFGATTVNQANGADPLFAVPTPANALGGSVSQYSAATIRELSEELRFTSDFNGPVNFMVGGYLQDQRIAYVQSAVANPLNPISLFAPVTHRQNGTAYSVFGNISVKPVATIELSGGARYSEEKKGYRVFRLLSGTLPASQGGTAYVAGQEVPVINPKDKWTNWSPEATITWRPNTRFTGYFGWKRGFLSGGYNATTATNVAVIADQSYDQEVVQGFEGGIKAQLLRGLRVNFAAFDYDIKGLQVASTIPGPPLLQVVNNAASARTKGVEGDFNWAIADTGLSVRGGLSYDKANYETYLSPCYGGQTIALGCNRNFNGLVFTSQDLSGRPLTRAPRWGAFLGSTYEATLANGGRVIVSADGNYTSKIDTDAQSNPLGIQKGYWLIDTSLRYEMVNGLNFGLVVRDLTNKYYFQRSGGQLLVNGPSGVATSVRSNVLAAVSRGREFRLQVGYRFR